MIEYGVKPVGLHRDPQLGGHGMDWFIAAWWFVTIALALLYNHLDKP